jgi:hypothetical protein
VLLEELRERTSAEKVVAHEREQESLRLADGTFPS